MKRGFTLIEMMIVVALIATLMTIVLRLSSVGSEETRRNKTIMRLARLENCLSGYYAAYGSYPPVALHNSRDINQRADSFGVQSSGEKSGLDLWGWDPKTFRSETTSGSSSSQDAERRAWAQVEAACKAQPLSLEAPDPDVGGGSDLDEAFDSLVKIVQEKISKGDITVNSDDSGYHTWNDGFGTIYRNLGGIDEEAVDWRDAQICKFGLMSYLLPRYQAMMGWRDSMFSGGDCIFDQWNANNGNVPHDPFTGEQKTWREINAKVIEANGSTGGSDSTVRKARAFLEAIPSESVTARWLPNLEKICTADMLDLSYFGVTINDPDTGGMFNVPESSLPDIKVYAPKKGQTSNLYHLNQITVEDGWGTEFFYYSPAPYQSYRLWSAGRNRRTFPVWIPREKLESARAKECVAVWTEDDMRGMSN